MPGLDTTRTIGVKGNFGYDFNNGHILIGGSPNFHSENGVLSYDINPDILFNFAPGGTRRSIDASLDFNYNNPAGNHHLNTGVSGLLTPGAYLEGNYSFSMPVMHKDGGLVQVDRSNPKYVLVNAKENPGQKGRINAMVKFFKDRGVDPNFMDTLSDDEFNDIFYLFGEANGDQLMEYCQNQGYFDKNRERNYLNFFK